jgi:hypothetical protein
MAFEDTLSKTTSILKLNELHSQATDETQKLLIVNKINKLRNKNKTKQKQPITKPLPTSDLKLQLDNKVDTDKAVELVKKYYYDRYNELLPDFEKEKEKNESINNTNKVLNIETTNEKKSILHNLENDYEIIEINIRMKKKYNFDD